MDGIEPAEMAEALASIPLFGEFRRVLAAGGPANWEIGGQIALALAGAGRYQQTSEDSPGQYEDACRLAELAISSKTSLEPPHLLTKVSVVDRSGWADIYLERFKPMIDRLATAVRAQLGTPFPVAGLDRFLDALGSFAMGAQVGFLVGQLSHEVISQYEIWLPAGRADQHIFVVPNAGKIAGELEAEPEQFKLWLAFHEVSRQLVLDSVEWSKGHLLRLVENFVDAAKVDVTSAIDRVQAFEDPEELNRLLQAPQDLLPLSAGGEQQGIGDQLQLLIALLEGYADWIMQQAAVGMLPQFEKITEGMVRRRVERSSASKMLEKLLGIDLKHENYRAGRRFVQSVAGAGKVDRLFQDPADLPTLSELETPSVWLSRVAFS